VWLVVGVASVMSCDRRAGRCWLTAPAHPFLPAADAAGLNAAFCKWRRSLVTAPSLQQHAHDSRGTAPMWLGLNGCLAKQNQRPFQSSSCAPVWQQQAGLRALSPCHACAWYLVCVLLPSFQSL
jgi:hypothetical protein